MNVGHYEIEYVSHQTEVKIDRIEQRARLNIYANTKLIDSLDPGYAFYPDHNMAATRAGIRSTVKEDLYIIASEFSDDGTALFRVYINPLVIWMWIAGPLMVLGTIVALWPERRPAFLSGTNQQLNQ